MKKSITALAALLLSLLLLLGGCDSQPQHSLSYVGAGRRLLFEDYDCIAVFTQYSNNSGESAIPADWVSVKAYQKGVELNILVPTGQRMDGAVPCDSSVQSGATADVVWFFQLDDESDVSIKMTGSEAIVVPLTEGK